MTLALYLREVQILSPGPPRPQQCPARLLGNSTDARISGEADLLIQGGGLQLLRPGNVRCPLFSHHLGRTRLRFRRHLRKTVFAEALNRRVKPVRVPLVEVVPDPPAELAQREAPIVRARDPAKFGQHPSPIVAVGSLVPVPRSLPLRLWPASGGRLRPGVAALVQRAFFATGTARCADQGARLHERLVPPPAAVWRNELRGNRHEIFVAGRRRVS